MSNLQPDRLFEKALTLIQSVKGQEAWNLLQRITLLEPSHFRAFRTLAILAAHAGQFAVGALLMERSLQIEPRDAASHQDFANMLQGIGQSERALLHYNESLRLDPGNAVVHYNRGNLLRDLGRHLEALDAFDQALTRNPHDRLAALNKGMLQKDKGDPKGAQKTHIRALTLWPHDAQHLSALAELMAASGHLKDAIKMDYRVAWIDPTHANSWLNLCNHLNETRNAEALSASKNTLLLSPNEAGGYVNHGIALHHQARFSAALGCQLRAITLQPNLAKAHFNRGNALRELAGFKEALASYDKAIDLEPTLTEAVWNKSTLLLLLGQLKEGFALYHARSALKEGASNSRPWIRPNLDPDRLFGKSVALSPEQGLGDTLQFARYAKLLADRGANVFLEVQPPLRRLLATMDERIQVVATGESLTQIDVRCPLLDLPDLLGTSLASIPDATPYLFAKASGGRSWTLPPSTKKRVGVAWAGNPLHKNDGYRSIPLSIFSALFEADADFVAIQKGLRSPDREALSASSSVWVAEESIADFADTATLIEHMDLVISVDTSVAHLAGALGKTTWILLPFMPDYRWLLDRTDSPWYPSVRLYRQSEDRRWSPVIAKIMEDLQSLVGPD